MKNKPGICSECGAKKVFYTYSLNQNVVLFLQALVKAGGEAKLSNLGLSYSVRCNAQKAGYWHLVSKGQLPYTWKLTTQGHKWLGNIIPIPRQVVVYRGKPVGWKGVNIKVSEIVPKAQDPEEFKRQVVDHLTAVQTLDRRTQAAVDHARYRNHDFSESCSACVALMELTT